MLDHIAILERVGQASVAFQAWIKDSEALLSHSGGLTLSGVFEHLNLRA